MRYSTAQIVFYLTACFLAVVVCLPMSVFFFAAGNTFGGVFMGILAVPGVFGPPYYLATGEIPIASNPWH